MNFCKCHILCLYYYSFQFCSRKYFLLTWTFSQKLKVFIPTPGLIVPDLTPVSYWWKTTDICSNWENHLLLTCEVSGYPLSFLKPLHGMAPTSKSSYIPSIIISSTLITPISLQILTTWAPEGANNGRSKVKVSSSSERGLIASFFSALFGIFWHNYLFFCLKKKKSVWNIKMEEKNQHCVSFLQHASMLLKNINPHKKCGKNICTFWLKRWLEKREKNITTDRILPDRTPVSYWWNTAEICSRGGE